jgi:DNA-binding CsgD family transcriptional regulator
MSHLAFLLYLVSFTTGCVSIGISLLIHQQYRKPVIRFYVLFLAGLALILASLIVNLYLANTSLEGDRTARGLSDLLDTAGVILMVYACPLLAVGLLGREPSRTRRMLLGLPALGLLVLAVLRGVVPLGPLSTAAVLLLMFGTIAGSLALLASRLGRIGDRSLRRALRTFLLVTLAFFPLLVVEILREQLTLLRWIHDLFELFSLPSYFFLLNLLSILFAVRYFNRPPYLARQELTGHFKSTFGITDREAEIITLLIQGCSYNQIADRLFIAYKTVDNHLRSIYQKTEVKNRLQLLNLIQANRAS